MNDLRGATIDLAADRPLLEAALFHCQQGIEKAFKAFLNYHQPKCLEELIVGGDLFDAVDQCISIKVDPTARWQG
ncbi:hypothetical protein [Candidatus Chloroploca asiatica]|uniref:HEPN domain-containing protein n=1 Tax=Candidatus Chloroploca asiatica TaxID=1506545 RepID=A0A2H3KKN4_9CHLR|nr:hypothetical protein [Candidatus Chloroploca asiatica]PDV97777.1 hypothetical protein A9Q02_17700 [Candidatus Chloroploca asiatica]